MENVSSIYSETDSYDSDASLKSIKRDSNIKSLIRSIEIFKLISETRRNRNYENKMVVVTFILIVLIFSILSNLITSIKP
jgi:di/tricarboxylate transporter